MKPIILGSKDIHYVWTANDCKIKVVDITAQEDLIKAAVELIDTETAHEAWLLNPIMGEQELADLRARYCTAKEELREAVYKWKEAQA